MEDDLLAGSDSDSEIEEAQKNGLETKMLEGTILRIGGLLQVTLSRVMPISRTTHSENS